MLHLEALAQAMEYSDVLGGGMSNQVYGKKQEYFMLVHKWPCTIPNVCQFSQAGLFNSFLPNLHNCYFVYHNQLIFR